MADKQIFELTNDTTPASTDRLAKQASLNGDFDAVALSNIHKGMTAASTTVASVSELATSTEVNTGTDATRAITPDALANSNYGAGASTTLASIVELATAAEVTARTDTDRAITPDALANSTYGKFLQCPLVTETISSGVADGSNGSIINVRGESAAADDLDSLSGMTAGTIYILYATNEAITVKQGAGFQLAGAADAVLGSLDTITLVARSGTNCLELSRSNN
jgi:hypothetical protein